METRNRTVHIAAAYTMKFSNAETHTDQAIGEFLKIGEAVAPRRIQMPKGVLFLQMNPDDPASGAIYVYDCRNQDFFFLGFEGCDDHLTVEDFEQLVAEYNLLQYAEKPELLQALYQTPGLA
jgi:hypothetical protein